MNCKKITEAKRYLARYDEILWNMGNEMLSQEVTDSITVNFIKCMIPHHEGAIGMRNNLLKYRIDTRLKMVAENIIKEQSNGVRELKEVQRDLCGNY